MNIKQAKQTLLDIKSENFCIDDIRIKERYDALNTAIKSLDMCDKVIKEIKNSKTNPLNQDPYIDMGIEKAIKIIEKYKKEIEE